MTFQIAGANIAGETGNFTQTAVDGNFSSSGAVPNITFVAPATNVTTNSSIILAPGTNVSTNSSVKAVVKRGLWDWVEEQLEGV